MEREQAVQIIKHSCGAISAELTRLHPAVGALGDQPIQDEMIKALFQLTKDLETVKKLVRKSEQGASG
jgi:hypothetical protein